VSNFFFQKNFIFMDPADSGGILPVPAKIRVFRAG
jgi:hypothetical protein